MKIRQALGKLKGFAISHGYIFLLLALSFFFFHNIISSARVMDNVHYINDVTFYSNNMKDSLKRHTLPLWTPYYYSGRPIFAQPEYYFIDINFLLVWITGNVYLSMNLSVILYLFIAGLGMYLLALYLFNDRRCAFISAIAYMFNGYVHTFVVTGNIMILEGYSLIPLIFLFTVKALKEKEYVFNSLIAGVFIALQIFAGGVIFLPFIFLIIACYCAFYALNRNFLSRILKLAIVGILIFAASFSLSAVKLLPGIEFMGLSNRGSGLPYSEFVGAPIKLSNFVYTFATSAFTTGDNISAAIGIIGLALAILGLSKIKDRMAMFSISIILISFALSFESFITKIVYAIPIINQTRHIERSIFLFAFASPILAALGFLKLQSIMEKRKKAAKNTAFFLVCLFLILELFLLQKMPQSVDVVNPSKIEILDYMKKDTSTFRTMNLALSTLIGASGYNYYSQFGISEIKGGSGIWFNDYINYLIVAQNSPSKFWGILNNKYVVADKNSSIDGFDYIGEFKACRECPVWEAYGPYLYKNKNYLPRYYTVPNSILVVGDAKLANQVTYSLMLGRFNPENTVIIEGTKIGDYSTQFLDRFSAIVLTGGSIDQNSVSKLSDYEAHGGIIIPNILSGKNSITDEDVNSIFNKMKGDHKEIAIKDYSNNKVSLELDGQKGWLVASERFSGFPGWKAAIGKKEIEILKANAIISAVYLEGEKENLIFEYEPNPYKKGKIISMAAVFAILAYMGYFLFKNGFFRKKSKVI